MFVALIRPSLISFCSNALLRSVVYLRCASSYWKSTLYFIILLSPITSGLPSAIANIFTPKVSSNLVFLYKIFFNFSTSAPFLSSKTIRMPFSSEPFEMSTMSVVFFVSTKSITSEINFPIPAPIIV